MHRVFGKRLVVFPSSLGGKFYSYNEGAGDGDPPVVWAVRLNRFGLPTFLYLSVRIAGRFRRVAWHARKLGGAG